MGAIAGMARSYREDRRQAGTFCTRRRITSTS